MRSVGNSIKRLASYPWGTSAKRTFISHWLDVLLIVLVWSTVVVSHFVYGANPNKRFFIEQDPSLSYPLHQGWASGEEIPNVILIILSVPVSMVSLFLFQVIATLLFRFVDPNSTQLHPKALNMFVLQLAFLEAFGMTLAATEFIKSFAGRLRPNFFALCDYQGYRNAVATNNFTEYLSLTHPGIPGNMSLCRATQREILEAQFSFPSGHASLIWCGMTFIAIYVLYVLHHYSPRQNMAKGILCCIFVSTAVLVTVTRTRDFWHNFDDVLAGALIGFSCSVLAFSLNYHPVVSSLYKKEQIDLVANGDVPDDKSSSNVDLSVETEMTPVSWWEENRFN
jgi:membrane-associated phospholipid phosphatase